MTYIIKGERMGKQGELRLGCSAVIFDKTLTQILLTRRSDNGMWCLPGGKIEAGESVAEGCKREVLEETGLRVRVTRLTGVYSDPNNVVVYPDGSQFHIVVMNFIVELLDGSPGLSDETTEVSWVPVHQAVEMNLFHNHSQHIRDALASQDLAFIR